jgi:hypothetical protein
MTHAALLLVLIAGYWQPVTVVPDPGHVQGVGTRMYQLRD